MSDAAAASHITDHPFEPTDASRWWERCAACGLSEAAHERTTLGPGGERLAPEVTAFTDGEARGMGEADAGRMQELILPGEDLLDQSSMGDDQKALLSVPEDEERSSSLADDLLPGVGAVGAPPNHYATRHGMDVFAVIDAFELDYFEGNAVKYIVRWRKKGGVADLRKAQHYIEEIILREARK